jgi:hypothetical protein
VTNAGGLDLPKRAPYITAEARELASCYDLYADKFVIEKDLSTKTRDQLESLVRLCQQRHDHDHYRLFALQNKVAELTARNQMQAHLTTESAQQAEQKRERKRKDPPMQSHTHMLMHANQSQNHMNPHMSHQNRHYNV